MVKGLDYAFAHPNLPCIRDNGFVFVARYVGDPDPNPAKYLDAAEVKALRTLGISIVACRETTAGFMLTDDGGTHARISRKHCNDLGLDHIPIYYALDVDPRGLTTSQINAVTRFLQNAAAADGGGHHVGLYGAASAIDRWVGTDYCHWGWQTYAWSAGRISPKAHFRQYRNGQAVCGGTVDLNETYAEDFGQWPRPSSQPEPEPQRPKDDKMYFLIKGDQKPNVYVTDLLHKYEMWDQHMINTYLYMIRANGGIIVAEKDTNAPQVWSQSHVDSIPKVAPVQILDFVSDPEGKDGVWFVLGSSMRWFVDTSDDEGKTVLAHHQNLWAARGFDVTVRPWHPNDLLRVPITNAGGGGGGPIVWPATGTVTTTGEGTITFNQ